MTLRACWRRVIERAFIATAAAVFVSGCGETQSPVAEGLSHSATDAVELIADPEGANIRGEIINWLDTPSAHLDHARHVQVWLPPGYRDEDERDYSVLYMFDGQNLFDPRLANFGVDWGVDETLSDLISAEQIEPVIVVSTWSTPDRTTEYSPWHDGPKLARFLIEELKPRIDTEFRTKGSPDNTAVMGASMGGLMAFHLVSEHPGVFGACGCLSSHFIFADGEVRPDPEAIPHILEDIATGREPTSGVRYWFDYGTKGLDALYEPVHLEVKRWLTRHGLQEGLDFEMRVYPDADHNETAWRERLADPLLFLFGTE